MRTLLRACLLATLVTGLGTDVSVFAQSGTVAQPPSATAPQVRRLTVDDAVRLAIENNLGIQTARFSPQIEDFNVLQARTGWTPTFNSTLQTTSSDQPNQNILAGAQGLRTSTDRFVGSFGLQQTLRWGGRYTVGWDNSRLKSNSLFATFTPQISSSLALRYSQPLLRDFRIDNIRQQVQISTTNREIADVQLRQQIASTSRNVRNAYWDLAYAISFLEVQRQSLDLALESLRNTRARVEIGTTPPIDIVEAEAEVATREEAVIVAEAQIATAEDTLRALVYEPTMPDFWTIRIEPTELPPFQPVTVNVENAVNNALGQRTDLQQSRYTLETNDVSIRYLRNQTLPDVTLNLEYGLQGLGGTLIQRDFGPFGPGTGPEVGRTNVSYGSVLGDLFRNEFPNWTASIAISYPVGTSQAQAGLARARLQQGQTQTQLRNQELQVTTQVREVGRQVQTNQRRVETTRASRQLAERRLEAEERKFAAGTSTSFLVFQAQRDLAQARNNELRAILDYNRSVVDFETVQQVPVGATGTAVTTVR